jgi:hypothetical protein
MSHNLYKTTEYFRYAGKKKMIKKQKKNKKKKVGGVGW